MQKVTEVLSQASKDLFNTNIELEITRPDEQFGDYATNIALQLAGKLNKNPREIAVALASKLHGQPGIAEVKIDGPGFINITLTDESLAQAAWSANELPKTHSGKEILVEFGDPNPFKEMHIGHLYSYVVGDCIARLLEASGAQVQRLSYHGDVGLHVAKAIWGMQKNYVSERGIPKAEDLTEEALISILKNNIGLYYSEGAQAYEKNEHVRAEINEINEHIYKRDDPVINELYDWGRERSLNYFELILDDLDIKTKKRYFESESAEVGMKFVHDHASSVFKKSEGAIIYDGEKVGLHTRVFITSKGLPTYEAKDLGLAELKKQDYPNTVRSIVITAHEQSEYFKVMLAALSEIDKELAGKTTHLTHGFVNLSSGKMSSRTGEVYAAANLIADVQNEVTKRYPDSPKGTDIGAIKYGFLKHRLGSDITYDVTESVSLEGNSGPYLQYAHARARSILQKAKATNHDDENLDFDQEERRLARKISEYPEVVEKATNELMPHFIATYLYELAQTFNRFYEKSRVVEDKREAIRVKLVSSYADVLKKGLDLLGITAPDKM